MNELLKILNQIEKVEDTVIKHKGRVVKTLVYAEKILGAAKDASNGDDEKAMLGALQTVASKGVLIFGPDIAPVPLPVK